ncbi:MAG: prepilin peptidase, partial [Myxococcota bacterium]|nr:prepilin peptidase [Myxococcota bacterium]
MLGPSPDLGLFFAFVAFSVGASIGSFVNVVVYRLPAGLSLVRPASRCPGCETPIKPWHNIPVLGWLMIRGRCASCAVPISVRYPIVELVMGLVAVALLHDFAGGWVDREVLIREDFLMEVVGPTLLYLVLVADLVVIALIDLDHFAVFNMTTYPLIPVGLLCAFAFGGAIDITWQDGVVGMVCGGGILLVITVVYPLIRGKEGMGWGDWHVVALIG